MYLKTYASVAYLRGSVNAALGDFVPFLGVNPGLLIAVEMRHGLIFGNLCAFFRDIVKWILIK